MKRFIFLFVIIIGFNHLLSAQSPAKTIQILWDTSYGMSNRDKTAELNYLNKYFNENQNLLVKLVVFSNTILVDESIPVKNGDWVHIKKTLKESITDGSTSYINILQEDVDEILLFTDGKAAYGNLPVSYKIPISVIYSVEGGTETKLKNLAENSKGKFINLVNESPNKQNLKQDAAIINVTGKVTSDGVPLEGAIIYSRELNKSTVTNNEGHYSIEANLNGSLKYSFFGKKTSIIPVPADGKKDIEMQDGNETLDEVVINSERKQEEEAIGLGMNKRPEKTIGYQVESIKDTDISDQDIDIETAISGQFSNINIKSDQDITQFLSRGNNMSMQLDQTGLIVVDGVPMEFSENSRLSKSGIVDPANIADITVLKGLAATNKWGTLGRNGVILITTKTASVNTSNNAKKNVKIGTTDTYDGGSFVLEELSKTSYIERLLTANSVDQAYEIYLNERDEFGENPNFYFNAATYFKKWQNDFVIEKILSNVLELPDTEASSLRALLYKYQELELHQSALQVIEKLIEIEPLEVQNYRNLALAQRALGDHEQALSTYKRLDRKQFEGITNYDNLQGTINNEYKNLIALHNEDLTLSGINPQMMTNLKLDTRVVVEWNIYDAEFDLQIVNPQKRFFTWSHTKKNEASRINREIALGYGLEEYFMTIDDKGTWLFNLTYYGNLETRTDIPLYIKITKYDNFGSINQSEQIKVIPIDEINQSYTLMTIKI